MKITAPKSMNTLAVILSLSFVSVAALPAVADEVRIPIMDQADRSAQAKLPRTGQTQTSVRQAFGAAQAMSSAVGKPPISQWDYPDFVVYFEGDRVIHAVLKLTP